MRPMYCDRRKAIEICPSALLQLHLHSPIPAYFCLVIVCLQVKNWFKTIKGVKPALLVCRQVSIKVPSITKNPDCLWNNFSDQWKRKQQIPASMVLCEDSPHKGPMMRKVCPCEEVLMPPASWRSSNPVRRSWVHYSLGHGSRTWDHGLKSNLFVYELILSHRLMNP